MMQGHLSQARTLSKQMLKLAKQANNAEASASLLIGHTVMGEIAFYQGECRLALEHLEQGIALYTPAHHRTTALLFLDAGVACLGYAVFTLWYLGYPEQALKRGQEAVSLAQELMHPYSLGFALGVAAWLHGYRREGLASQRQAEATVAVSKEHGFPSWLALGTVYRGWALVGQGHSEAGIAQIEGGLSGWRATGVQLAQPMFLEFLAEGYGQTGQPEEGLQRTTEALALVGRTEQRIYEAELNLTKGDLLLQQSSDNTPQAEAAFQQALDVARRQEAKSLELRAAMSLARLWQQQGKKTEAHKLLSGVYSWFTEGFDTQDLIDAKALIDSLEFRGRESSVKTGSMTQ
jgi:predicted ATPase